MTHRTAIVLALVLALACTAPVQAATTDAPAIRAPLVVDDDGDAQFTSVGAALEAAGPGDTVRVLPGTYHESVAITADVRLVAPRGATLDGTGVTDGAAIEIRGDAAPVVEGFTVTGYDVGVDAGSTDGDWTVRNTTVRDVGRGVHAVYSTGDWRLRNVTVRNASDGVVAVSSSGDWSARDSVVADVTEGHGVDASPSSGDWTLRNVTVRDVDFVGVAASYSAGDWRVLDSAVRDTLVGIGAVETSGDWALRESTVASASTTGQYDILQPPLTEGVAVDASGSNGSWTVRRTRFVDNDAGAIVASAAAPAGDARRNWWGGDGPDGDDCTGNVDCGAPLATWPPRSRTATPATADTGTTTSTPADASPVDATGSPPSRTGDPGTRTEAPGPAGLAAAGVVLAALALARGRSPASG